MEGFRRSRNLPEEQLAKLESLFGKLRITYTPKSITTELDEVIETNPYKVIGSGPNAVVIQDLAQRREPDLGLSGFMIIHFDGPDAYWLDSELGELREYFRRVDR